MKLFACALMLTVAATDGPPPLTLDHGPKRICIRGGVNDGACFVRVAESAVIDVPRAVQNFDRAYDDHNQPRDPTQRFTPGEVRSMAAAAPLNGELRRRVREGFRTLRISEVAVDPMAIITIDRGRDVAFVATITWAARDDARAEVDYARARTGARGAGRAGAFVDADVERPGRVASTGVRIGGDRRGRARRAVGPRPR